MIRRIAAPLRALCLVVMGLVWRSLGLRAAGRRLLRAADSRDPTERMLAGIPVVKAGARSVDLIEAQFRAGDLSAMGVHILADIDDPRTDALLHAIALGDGPNAEAAAEGLARRERLDGTEPAN